MAYPPLILATTAAAMDMEAGIFFTFYGLNIIKKSTMASLKIPPLANPAMPVPMPNIMGALPRYDCNGNNDDEELDVQGKGCNNSAAY